MRGAIVRQWWSAPAARTMTVPRRTRVRQDDMVGHLAVHRFVHDASQWPLNSRQINATKW